MMPLPLVTTGWLADHLDDPALKILDAGSYQGGKNLAEFAIAHIPGAAPFDLENCRDKNTDLPNMLPAPEVFAEHVGKLGIGNDDSVVIYDAQGIFTSPRVWWMFRYFGHEKVAVLDGGLPKWRAEKRKINSGQSQITEKEFTARPNPALLRDYDQIAANIKSCAAQLIDARSVERFQGKAPEPRPNLPSGHIPGSCNLPFSAMLRDDQTFKNPAELRQIFAKTGVDLEKPVIMSCGSGITACIPALGLAVLGKFVAPIYDGAWSEWGAKINKH
ncbi:MAG: 3-mercaptopyruvate sulfurtransferase [Dongiaceae bacterium]